MHDVKIGLDESFIYLLLVDITSNTITCIDSRITRGIDIQLRSDGGYRLL